MANGVGQDASDDGSISRTAFWNPQLAVPTGRTGVADLPLAQVGNELSRFADEHGKGQSSYVTGRAVDRFITFAADRGVTVVGQLTPDLVEEWMSKPVKARPPRDWTRSNRRNLVHGLFEWLRREGYWVVDPSPHEPISNIRAAVTCPATDGEIDRIRTAVAASDDGRRLVVHCLAEATATSAEIAGFVPRNVDLEAGIVDLRGVQLSDRSVALTDWALSQLREQHGPGGKDWPVLLRSETVKPYTEIGGVLRQCLHSADLRRAGLGKAAVRGWRGRLVYETEGLEAARQILGLRSFDAAMRAIGLEVPS